MLFRIILHPESSQGSVSCQPVEHFATMSALLLEDEYSVESMVMFMGWHCKIYS